MPSQWILIIALVLVAVYLLKAKRSASQQAIRRLVILGVLAAGVLATLFPTYTNALAAYVGIGRGVDLIFYAFIVFMLFYIVHQFRRQLWQEKVTTDLARALTLTQAALEDSKKSGSKSPQ
jgi:hypothetical protein